MRGRRPIFLSHLISLASDSSVGTTRVDSGMERTLVRDQAAQEVVLERHADQESQDPADDPASTKTIVSVEGGCNNNLEDLKSAPDKGTDHV